MTAATPFRTLALVALLLLFYSPGDTQQQSPAKQAERSVSALYDTIRRIAFPASPDLQKDKTKADGRFILMMPGKVLNYQDYHPGPEYTEFIQVRDMFRVQITSLSISLPGNSCHIELGWIAKCMRYSR